MKYKSPASLSEETLLKAIMDADEYITNPLVRELVSRYEHLLKDLEENPGKRVCDL